MQSDYANRYPEATVESEEQRKRFKFQVTASSCHHERKEFALIYSIATAAIFVTLLTALKDSIIKGSGARSAAILSSIWDMSTITSLHPSLAIKQPRKLAILRSLGICCMFGE